jgi:hydrophobic/amphiphilic exporter-1 (mainly G- bacteria), HAE1 family
MFEKILNRPVTIVMFFASLFILGTIAFNRIPLELKPDTEYPTLIVNASWSNVSPETIEKKVISVIESEVYTLENIYKVSSSSQSSYGSVTIEYKHGTDMNFAYLALNEKLFQVKKDLPEAVRNRVNIRKYVPRDELDESRELISYNIYGNIALEELGLLIESNLKNDLMSIEGINSVEISGIPKNELRILVDRKKAEFYGITINHLSKLYRYGSSIDAGEISDSEMIRFSVDIDNELKSIGQINDMVLKYNNGVPVRIRDVAEVYAARQEPLSIRRINGQESVDISVFKEPGANAISTCDLVYEAFKDFTENYSRYGLQTQIKYDSTESIRKEISDIKFRGMLSLLVIVLVLLFFLKNIKLSVVIVISVAISLLASGFVLYFFDFTLNIVTLSGLVLSFGLLVDNSVVVLENIVRHYNLGTAKFKATVEGTKEVILPVLSSTLTTVVVFIPFLYMTGERRLYWIPMAIAVGTSLMSSFFVSITLTPILTGLFLTEKYRSSFGKQELDEFKGYSRVLKFFIRNRKVVLILTALCFYFSYYLFDRYVDKGRRFNWNIENTVTLYISMPVGSTVEMADGIIKNFEARIIETGGYDKFTTNVSSRTAYVQIKYTDDQYYTIAPFEMENQLVSMAVNFSGPFINIRNPLNQSGGYRSGGTTSKSYNSTMILKGYDYEGLKTEAQKLERYLVSNPRISDVDITGTGSWWRSSDQFSYTISLDRKKLSAYNANVTDLVREIRSSCGGSGTNIFFNSEEIEMTVKYSDYKDFNIKDLMDKVVKTGSSDFRIKDIAEIKKEAVMNDISKEDQNYTRYVRYDYNSSAKQAAEYVSSIKKTYPLPMGYKFDEEDQDYMTDLEKKEMLWLILLAVVLVYMVTAALFESFLHPFVIILSVPLSLTGVFGIFFGLQELFNEDAYMGVILLEGIVVNNSIILIHHINSKRLTGLNLLESIISGTIERIRPVLMTSITTILGVLPLIINSDSEKNFWYSFSITTIGGLAASTFFVLTVLPVMYAFFERVKVQTAGFFKN